MIRDMQFENIKEIKFTRVGENTFAVSIKSDLRKDNNFLSNAIFESELCVIDSPIRLSCEREFVGYDINCLRGVSETYTIPMTVKLLLDKNLKMYTIKPDNN